jgi:ABC-type lipoprotein export system ATPase subunit
MTFLLRDVRVAYHGIPALMRVNLEYGGSGVLVLNGATGAGKTTLLRLLWCGLLPSSGEVLVDGVPTTRMRARARRLMRRSIGVAGQHVELVQAYTVFENVLMPLSLRGVRKDEATRLALEVLAELNVSHCREKHPTQLSGGEHQLVTLARALAMEPGVLIADEPVSMLDAAAAQRVQLALQARVDRGMGLVLSTHSETWTSAFASASRYEVSEGLVRPLG